MQSRSMLSKGSTWERMSGNQRGVWQMSLEIIREKCSGEGSVGRCPQGRPQAGARWCTCTPWILLFRFFQNTRAYPCTASNPEAPSNSFLQSEIRQQVLLFHNSGGSRNSVRGGPKGELRCKNGHEIKSAEGALPLTIRGSGECRKLPQRGL